MYICICVHMYIYIYIYISYTYVYIYIYIHIHVHPLVISSMVGTSPGLGMRMVNSYIPSGNQTWQAGKSIGKGGCQ